MEDPVTPLKRDEAIRKVAAFLKANYPCYCDQEGKGLVEECDELDEACSIVEIVESTAEYIRWGTPRRRPWPTGKS